MTPAEERALNEDTVIPVGEEAMRKQLGVTLGLIAAGYAAAKGGIEKASPVPITALLNVGFAFFISGFMKTCGCSMRLAMRVHHQKAWGTVARPAPETHKPLVRRKRRQLLLAYAAAAVAAPLVTVGAHAAVTGTVTRTVVVGSLKGVAWGSGILLGTSAAYPVERKKRAAA